MKNNIPEFLVEELVEQYGEEKAKSIVQGLPSKRKVTFRVNTLKSTTDEIEKMLKEKKIEFKTVEWSKEAFVLMNMTEKEMRKLEIYQDGKVYLQSLSSMLPPIVLRPKQGKDILDMTAAPGGKTTQIAAMTDNKANITACEMNKIRAERLKYNIEKQGAKIYVMIQDARKIDDLFSFDQILLDAPCSGSGTLYAQDSQLKEAFSMKRINKSIVTQLALLKKAINLLKIGQEMVYSTCSILACENEKIVQQVIKEGRVEIVPIDFHGKKSLPLLPTGIEGTLCVKPNEWYEGFFVAKMKKIK